MATEIKRPPGSDLLSGVVATAALGGAYLGLHLPVLVAAGVAVAVYGGLRLLLSVPAVSAHGSDSFAVEVVENGRRQVVQLRELSGRIAKPSVRASVAHICILAEQIFAIFLADPGKTPLARGFVEYTLGKTSTIVTRYCELSSRALPSAKATLDKAESLLATIDASFGEQIEKLLREDVADLDSQIEVLQTRLEIEADIRE